MPVENASRCTCVSSSRASRPCAGAHEGPHGRTRALSLALVVFGAAGSACTASIDDSGPNGQPGGGAGPGGAAGAGSVAGPRGGAAGGGGRGSVSAQACTTQIQPGPSPVRRLTRYEYNNTVRDLLGDTSNPANAFPAEEVGNGFGNDATALGVSRLLAESYLNAAKGIADRAVPDDVKLNALIKCGASEAEAICTGRFIDDFGARAFRRPLEARERDVLKAVYQAGRTGFDVRAGVQAVITAALQMPQFLYRVEFGSAVAGDARVRKVDHHEAASRLSYLFWASMPDADLFAAAKAGQLGTKEQLRRQAERLLASDRAKPVVRYFHDMLYGLLGLDGLMKDPKALPAFTPELGGLFRQEAERFIDHVIWEGPGDFKTLMTGSFTFANGKLASFYGLAGGPTGDTWQKVNVDPKRRGGILTQGAMLAASTPGTQTNPVIRGVVIRKRLMCDSPADPPAALMVREPDPDPTLTTRERFTAHQTEPSCVGCHKLLDPVGHGLENFDALGQWRDRDNGKPIDNSGYILRGDVTTPYRGPIELAQTLAADQDTQRCFADQWMSFAYGRGFDAADDCSRSQVFDAFVKSGLNVKALLLALTQTDAFVYRQPAQP